MNFNLQKKNNKFTPKQKFRHQNPIWAPTLYSILDDKLLKHTYFTNIGKTIILIIVIQFNRTETFSKLFGFY